MSKVSATYAVEVADKEYRRGWNEAIEECAQRVKSWTMHRGYNSDVAAELAAAIRALKDSNEG